MKMQTHMARMTVAVLLSAILFPLVLASAFAQGDGLRRASAPPSASSKTVVYRAAVVYRQHGRVYRRLEWVSPSTGEWKIREGKRTILHRPGLYVSMSPSLGTYVRTGSPTFLGHLQESALSLRPIKAYGVYSRNARSGITKRGSLYTFMRGHAQVSVRVLGHRTLSDTQARQLFEPRLPLVTRRAAEVAPGAKPTLPVRAYWLGPAAYGRVAQTSVQYTRVRTPLEKRIGANSGRREARAYITFYEVPEAGETSSAVPSQTPPAEEIQIVNQPISLPLSQATIAAFNGTNGDLRYEPWPRETIMLKDGETATVVPNIGEGTEGTAEGEDVFRQFAVITGETLVWVSSGGDGFKRSEILRIASALEPVSG
jgi:hypothetical protein